MPSRRKFLGEAACAALGSSSIISTLLNLSMANRAAAQSLAPGDDRKTLVCVFLHGGMDSFNVLVPRDSRYQNYASSRSNLALDSAELIPLDQAPGGDGNLYGLHPSMTELANLFNGPVGDPERDTKRRLSFVSNLGTLIEPTTLSQYASGSVQLPRALFSHIDQIEQWQTSLPQGREQLSGWAGRAADVLHSTYNSGFTSMSISLAGNNVFQVGENSQQFVITPSGALSFAKANSGQPANHPLTLKNEALNSLMDAHYDNLVQQAYADLTHNSIESGETFQTAFDSFNNNSLTTPFPAGYLAAQLRGALKTIATRQALGLRRQTIFISYGGWDHHGELLETQAGMLRVLSQSLAAFQAGLEELNLADSVITYTASDFGRTLRSNGRGTDHAWGGNQMVMGAPVQGGIVAGAFPDLALDGANDVGRGGRILPSTSVDEFFGEMLRWFGVSPTDMPYVLPNFPNFHSPSDLSAPVGFMKS